MSQGRSYYRAPEISKSQGQATLVGKDMEASGKLDKITINLTVNLEIPHHQGAGGEDDFAHKETFQKQLKKKRKEEEHKKSIKEARKQNNTRDKNK